MNIKAKLAAGVVHALAVVGLSAASALASTQGLNYEVDNSVSWSYGFDNHNGTFWMASGPYAGQTLTATQIAADFPDSEAYAWVGVVYTGTPVTGYISSINGVSTSHRNVSIAPNAENVLIAAVR